MTKILKTSTNTHSDKIHKSKVVLGKKYRRGSATLEILIAFAILIICMSVIILIVFGNQSITVDTETNNEALYKAQSTLENARSLSRQDFSSLVSSTIISSSTIPYTENLIVADLTQCKKQATSTVTWMDVSRPQKIELSAFFTDVATAFALGGDCITDPPSSNWNNPQRFASDTFNPGKSTTIDVLNKIAYLGQDHTPFFVIADTHGATLGQTNGLFVSFTNGFVASTTINDLDAISWHDPITGNTKQYIYAAMNSLSGQLQVIDTTDIHKPVVVATRSLSSCVTGSAPQGWVVSYYDNRLYLTVRFTAGPEFHIFDVTAPTNPTEIGTGACKGTELGDTVEDFVVKDQAISGTLRRFIYMATDESNKELRVFEVTHDTVTEVTTANQDLPGVQDGASVFLSGNKLYFGRQSTPGGADLYIFNISNPLSGLTTLGSQDIGTGVIGIRVAGRFAFLSTPKTNKEFQVWDISSSTNITNVSIYNFGNVVSQGVDYEPDFIYATGQSSPNFQIIYSP